MLQSFRDFVSTIDEKGKRIWLYPKQPKGRYYTLRTYVSILLFALFFSIPFIYLHGEPLLLLNVIERKFIIFGKIFWTQDFYLLVLVMITFIIFIILFTVVYGRLFCGWICPQTLFMEMLFRRIEYWIEGNWQKQKHLDNTPWNKEKISKKTLKHLLFFLLSFIIANIFLAYIIGSRELIIIITEPISQHWLGFSSLLIFTTVFYWVFAKFREQVCIVVCPYGRLQGVLLDKNSVVVAYDYKRGEKKKFIQEQATNRRKNGYGDCVDCGQCVAVCPTGIDIRNGTQLECINCTACIDACDNIMQKIGFPKQLIRYTSEENIANKQKFRFTTRILAYSLLLLILLGLLSYLLTIRKDFETIILRTPGILYQIHNDSISNLYNYKIINKTNRLMPVHFRLESINGSILIIGKDIFVQPHQITEGAMFIYIHKNSITKTIMPVSIGIYQNEKLINTVNTNFFY